MTKRSLKYTKNIFFRIDPSATPLADIMARKALTVKDGIPSSAVEPCHVEMAIQRFHPMKIP